MREVKILLIVVALSLITYWGVEPYAHKQMHPSVEAPDYEYSDLPKIDNIVGDATSGKVLVQSNCIACHSIQKDGIAKMVDDKTNASMYGVVPPDLSSAGLIYDDNFLAAYIKNPAKASKIEHKFKDGKIHPMPGYSWMSDQNIADMIAYLNSIAPMSLSNKEVFKEACQRCHGIKYADMFKGTMNSYTPDEYITNYMGVIPPDLSQHIKSRGEKYLHEFINNPQKHLNGTSMPRVGLTKDAQQQVIDYMTTVGDSKKEERESIGVKVILYFIVFAIFAWLWKIKIWREVK